MNKPAAPQTAAKKNERHYYPTPKQEIALGCPCKTIFFGGSRGGGKMAPYDSEIVTPYGIRRFGDIKIGDIITNPEDGGMQKVIQIWEHGMKDVYRVFFSDGRSYECGLEHLWLVKKTCSTSKKRKFNNVGKEAEWRVKTFAQIKKFLDDEDKRVSKTPSHLLVPLSAPVKFTKSYKYNMRTINPYVLGLLIGDGCITGSLSKATFTTAEPELADAFTKAGYPAVLYSPKQYIIKSDNLVEELKRMKLWGNRSETHFIPEYYKLGTIEDRIALIQGLFDADGTADDRGHVSFCTASKRLAEDVQWIIRSLGGKATITESPAGYRKPNGEYVECKLCYDVYVNTDINKKLFRLQRKIDRCKDEFNGGVSERALRIVGYEYVGKKQCRCITVDGEMGLYLGNDFIVTHNSHCCRFKIMQHAQLYGKNARMIFMRRSLRELEQFIDQCKVMFSGIATWKEQKKRFEFINGAICEFNYLEGESVHNYQGAEFTLIILDEVGQFDSYDDVKLLKGCLRSAAGVPCQLFMTGNPGGRLHNILKAEFIDPAPQGMVPIMDTDPNGRELGTYRVYIPSTLFENPHLLENDPEYISNLLQVGSPEMVRAWIKGDWNIISGGAFDKLFDRDIHVIKPFRIPTSWRIVECYDDGLTRPAAALWFAISDGSDYYLPNGERRSTIRGDVFVIAELYFWTGKPNEGTAESIQSKAEKIKRKEAALGYEISQRIADSAIFSTKTHSAADEFMENGVAFDRCNKAPGTRLQAASLFRNALMGSLTRRKPGIFFFSTCINCIRTIPTLPRDRQNPDDVDSKAEDHCLHGDTIIHTLEYGSVPIRELVGKTGHCMTAGGYYAKFNNCKCFQHNAEMVEIVTVDNLRIVCTADHRILTDTHNYAEAKEWMSESFRTRSRISTVRHFINAESISSIREKGCIGQFGNITSEQFLKERLSTTSTEIKQTTASAILRLLQARETTPNFTKCSIQNLKCPQNALKPQRTGTNLPKEESGIDFTMSETARTKCTDHSKELALFAESLLWQGEPMQSFVANTTHSYSANHPASMMSRESVLSAEAALLATNICTLKPARGIASGGSLVKSVSVLKEKSDAYCLTTDVTHSIVVNDGIVVANCYDGISYLLLSDYDAQPQVYTAGNC